MHNHFNQFLNLKKLILDRKPKIVVECGAGNGELTRLLADLLDVYSFELHVVSDYPVEGLDPRIHWVNGLSYEALKQFPDRSIGLCVIDTDHNFWTLVQELNVLAPRMAEGGLIAMHDVETFYHDTGMARCYSTGDVYPENLIMEHAPNGSLGDALIGFLSKNSFTYKLLAYTPESHGAAVIERKTQTQFVVVVPGTKPMYSKKEIQHASV